MVRGSRLTGVIAAATLVAAAVLAVGCGSTPTTGSSCSKTWKVGLVTDVGKLSDKSFNFDSYKGVQDAQADSSLCVQGRAIESSVESDYPKNIGQFVDQKYDMIVTVGAKYTNPKVKVLKIYQPESGAKDFNDPDWGKQQATTFFGQGADIIFGVGGNTGNGGLLAAKEKGKMCIGVDVDQYVSYPDVDSCLITSAEKHLDKAVKTAITTMVQGSFKSGLLTFEM